MLTVEIPVTNSQQSAQHRLLIIIPLLHTLLSTYSPRSRLSRYSAASSNLWILIS